MEANSIPLLVCLLIVLVHWIGDFVLQTDWQAQNKSKNWRALLDHTVTYSACWVPFSLFFAINNIWFLLFVPITFLIHTITDYFTSRINSKLFGKNWHNFFVAVSFDQLLHYFQLFWTFYFLSL